LELWSSKKEIPKTEKESTDKKIRNIHRQTRKKNLLRESFASCWKDYGVMKRWLSHVEEKASTQE
jgi:hypothetical protein